MPYAPPYFNPSGRSRGAYLYGWRQEQAYVYVKNFPPAAGHHPCILTLAAGYQPTCRTYRFRPLQANDG